MNSQTPGKNSQKYGTKKSNNIKKACFLTWEAADFINGQSIKKMNLYLSQNRYGYAIEEQRGGRSKSRQEPMLMDLLNEAPVSSGKLNLNSLLKKWVERNSELAAAFPRHGEYNVYFPGRVILGEGGSTPYSNIVLLKLHPLYGVPYLPASTVKGVLRSSWSALAAEESGGDKKEEDKETEDRLFGTAEEEKGEGALVFFDAFPEEFTLTLDVETPHYPDYYGEVKSPTEDQSPRPIKIICMEKVKLPIHVACQDKALWESQERKLKDALKQMIEIYGVGAKTALGYGIGILEQKPFALRSSGANRK